jgi:hypothetical protein
MPSTPTLRAGYAGAAARHHGPRLRATHSGNLGRDEGMALSIEQGNGIILLRNGFVKLRAALIRKTRCRLTPVRQH